MSNATKRSILRWIHIVLGIPIVGYVYSPFPNLPSYAPLVRFAFLPGILASGLWMWQITFCQRLGSRKLAQPTQQS
jgi:hypothetical protein